MPSTVPHPDRSAHREKSEIARPVMAKADLTNREVWRTRVGRAVQRAFSLAGLTQQQAADLIQRDRAQVARWASGGERPQLDALFAVETLRQPLIQAFSELAGADVEITVRLRRPA